MVLLAIFPAAVCLLGLLAYALATNPKVSECGRLAFFAGLLVLCFVFAGSTALAVHVGR